MPRHVTEFALMLYLLSVQVSPVYLVYPDLVAHLESPLLVHRVPWDLWDLEAQWDHQVIHIKWTVR